MEDRRQKKFSILEDRPIENYKSEENKEKKTKQ